MKAVFLDYDSASNSDTNSGVLTEVLPSLILYDQSTTAEVLARSANAEVILLNKALITRQVIESAANLKLIALTATGTNNIDLQAARERDVAVCNIRGYCTSSLVQHAWAMILNLTHHLREYRELATDGHWQNNPNFNMLMYPIRELRGKVLGIVGWGELGGAVANVGRSFGMSIVIARRPGGAADPQRLSLSELLARSDIVSLHCPLLDETRGMIGAAQLALMKPDALLINTARGALIDSHALAQALHAGKLGGAGIDVLSQEPPVDGDPLLDRSIPNLLVTPHIAWSALEARQRCLDELALNVRDFLAGGRRGRVV